MIAGASLFLFDVYYIQSWISDSFTRPLSLLFAMFSLLMFIGGLMNSSYKESRFYKATLRTAIILIVLIILWFTAGVMQVYKIL